jgi:hypothetical protein
MSQVLLGITIMGAATSGLFFLRFWRRTGDRLFALFAISFWLLTANWIGLAVVSEPEEARTLLYVIRLAAFALMIVAIVDKNRAARRPSVPGPSPRRDRPAA